MGKTRGRPKKNAVVSKTELSVDEKIIDVENKEIISEIISKKENVKRIKLYCYGDEPNDRFSICLEDGTPFNRGLVLYGHTDTRKYNISLKNKGIFSTFYAIRNALFATNVARQACLLNPEEVEIELLVSSVITDDLIATMKSLVKINFKFTYILKELNLAAKDIKNKEYIGAEASKIIKLYK